MKKLPLVFALVLLLSLCSAAAEGVNPYQETPVENAGQETLVYTGVDFGAGASLLRVKGATDSELLIRVYADSPEGTLIAKARAEGRWTLPRPHINIYRGVKDGEWAVNVSRLNGVDATDPG